MVGAAIGAISDAARQQEAQRIQESYNQTYMGNAALIDHFIKHGWLLPSNKPRGHEPPTSIFGKKLKIRYIARLKLKHGSNHWTIVSAPKQA